MSCRNKSSQYALRVALWMQADDSWEDEPSPGRRARRGRLLAAAAAVPWLIALALVVRSGEDQPPVAVAAAGPPAPASEPESPASPSGPPDRLGHPRLGATPPPATYANRPRVTVTEADAVAKAPKAATKQR